MLKERVRKMKASKNRKGRKRLTTNSQYPVENKSSGHESMSMESERENKIESSTSIYSDLSDEKRETIDRIINFLEKNSK